MADPVRGRKIRNKNPYQHRARKKPGVSGGRGLGRGELFLNNKYRVLLFDLGGVVIDTVPFAKLLEWQSWTKDAQELEQKWSESLTAREYEEGRISTKEFVERITDEFELDVSVARFLREYRLIPKGFYPGAPELLDELGKTYTVACFSNTNELHWNKICDVDKLEQHFARRFASHVLHESKPHEEAYRHVLRDLKCPAGAVAFFDDRADNVAAAKQLGIDAHQTRGFEALRAKLAELGIL